MTRRRVIPESAMARQYQGVGLGLALTERLVHALGGTIQVSSTLGVGSSFRVMLPRRLEIAGSPERNVA